MNVVGMYAFITYFSIVKGVDLYCFYVRDLFVFVLASSFHLFIS